MKIIYSVAAILFFTINAHSQTIECGTDVFHNYLLSHDADYRTAFLEHEELIRQKVDEIKSQPRSVEAVLNIPVVVHVIHLGEPVGTGLNISNAQITGALQYLNALWRNKAGKGTDMGVEFCLATVDPSGKSTTGINRVNGSGVSNYSPSGLINFPGDVGGADEGAIKALSRWPMNKYINIWVTGGIYNSFGTEGYARFPNTIYNDLDGIVMKYTGITSIKQALAHEMGHYFNLYHTFQGAPNSTTCPPNADCLNDGDKVCDTSPHKQSSCSVCDSTGNLVFKVCDNIMNYGESRLYFTPGQRDRVLATFQGPSRSWLLENNFCGVTAIDDWDVANNDIALFPNPVQDKLHLTFSAQEATVVVSNLLGEHLIVEKFFGEKALIDVSKLPSGLYFVNGRKFFKE